MPNHSQTARIKPSALRQGDTVGIVAPASSFKREDFEAGCAVLRQMGYNPVYDESIFDHDLYFSGSVERRVRALEEMFMRGDVKAILCARGGYGSNYLLPSLDAGIMGKMIAHPKIFMGYSDLTTLLTRICDAGMVTFHGPMVAKDFAKGDGVDLESWQSAVGGAQNCRIPFGAESGVKSLVQGWAEGVLYGGCLSMLVASLGTPYEIRTNGTILFIEDVGTKPYQIDRMLMHLKLAGKLDGVRGFIFGEMLDCVQGPNQGHTLEEVIMRIIGDRRVPVAYGVRSGHVSRANITLPIGVSVLLKVGGTGVSLELLEAATIE
jgi:muramoyltetrapeptide carboxypeptidase